MPYQQLEDIRSRKKEKVALFLTAENLVGLMGMTMPVYVATASFHSFALRLLLLAVAATLGLLLTLEYGGLAAYERLLWRLRGVLRLRTAGAVLTPAQFSPLPVGTTPVILPVNGPVRAGGAPRPSAPGRVATVVRPGGPPRAAAWTLAAAAATPAQEPSDAHV